MAIIRLLIIQFQIMIIYIVTSTTFIKRHITRIASQFMQYSVLRFPTHCQQSSVNFLAHTIANFENLVFATNAEKYQVGQFLSKFGATAFGILVLFVIQVAIAGCY